MRLPWAEGGAPGAAFSRAYDPDSFEGKHQALFGIVQGGMYKDLRAESAERLVEMDFPGYAIGGLAVGEPREVTREMIAHTLACLPKDKPRYVMGVGYPDEIEEYARMGVDMMDCVLPTRAGRHGLVFLREDPGNRASSVVRLNIKRRDLADDTGPIDPGCECPVCRRYTRGVSAPSLRERRAAGRHAELDPQPRVLSRNDGARARGACRRAERRGWLQLDPFACSCSEFKGRPSS